MIIYFLNKNKIIIFNKKIILFIYNKMKAHNPIYKRKESKPKMNKPNQRQNFNNKIGNPINVNRARPNFGELKRKFEYPKKQEKRLGSANYKSKFQNRKL